MLSLVIGVFVIVLLVYLGSRKPKNYPPGPFRLPLLGFIPYLKSHLPHKQLRDLSKTYGPTVGIFMGRDPYVILNSYESLKEMLMNEDLLGRISGDLVTDRTWGERLGVLFTEGPFWQSQRRFTLHQFRDLGLGKKSHVFIIQEDLLDMIEEIKGFKGPFNLQQTLGVSAINVLWALMGGTTMKREDERLHKLVNHINKLFQSGSPFGNILASLPFLKPLIAESSGFNSIIRGFVSVRDFIMESVEEHKKTFVDGEVRDFFDLYLQKLKSSEDDSFSEKQLVAVCMDLFTAGVETTSSMISFCILYMCLYPEIQKKVQEEIDEVVGKQRLPNTNDRINMPYVDAVYTEVFRFRCPAPTTPPHVAMNDTTLQGYHIPKGTALIGNLYAVFMSPEYWGDPEVFRPERFMSEEGKVKKNEHFFPFGKGKRSCIGEALARVTTFLTFTSLMQHFAFTLDSNITPNDTEGTSGFTLAPPQFKVTAVLRD